MSTLALYFHFDSFVGTGMLGPHNVEHAEGSMSELIERDATDDSWLDMESIDHVMSTARSVRRKLDFERVVEKPLRCTGRPESLHPLF